MTHYPSGSHIVWNGGAELSKIHLDVLDPDVLQHCLADRIGKRLEKSESAFRHHVGHSTDDRPVVDRIRELVTQRGAIHVIGEGEIDLERLCPILLARERTMVTEDAQSADLHPVHH